MRLDEFITKLEGLGDHWGCEVCVEVNGVAHEIHDVHDDSQGITILVDTDAEERAMR
jgi:hypothetical protein